jgi:hypothetical protein
MLKRSDTMGKCKYTSKCKHYTITSTTCNETHGMYYEDRPAGCYRKFEEDKHEN